MEPGSLAWPEALGLAHGRRALGAPAGAGASAVVAATDTMTALPRWPGDVIADVAGGLMISRTMLADRIAHARVAITVTVRAVEEAVLPFAER